MTGKIALAILLITCTAALAQAAPYRVQWNANTDGVTAGYFIFYGTASGVYQPVNGIDVGNATGFDVDLTPGQTYYFVVRAYDSENILGPASAELSFTVPNGPYIVIQTVGSTIGATVGNGPGNQMDYVGLYAVGSPNGSFLQRKYLNNTFTPGGNLTAGTVTFTMPTEPGQYNVRFVSAGGATLATSATVTVSPAGSSALSIGNATVVEGNSGSVTANFTVTLSPVNTSQTVTVNYATANGSATAANNDYTAASGTLTFSPGIATRTISVPVRGDTTIEQNETFVVNLSGANNATISDGQGVGTITNDDAASGPAVTVASTSVQPRAVIQFTVSGGPGNRMDWVTLAQAGAADSNYLDWMYLNGTKTAPATGRTSATLQFAAPATPGNYNIRFFADNRLTNRLATSATITVATQPTLTIGNATVTEGNSGTSTATFTVSLSPVNTSQTVTVAFATANGTATTGNNDFVATSGTLTFAPSTGTQTVSVPIVGDTTVEANETFVVNLSGATNAIIGDAQGTGTIANDDSTSGGTSSSTSGPAVNLSSTTVQPGAVIQFAVSGGPGNRMDWVTLTPATASDGAYIDWNYLNGTKTAPSSGASSADNLRFHAPNAAGTYTVRFFADNRLTRLATSATITVASQPTLTIGSVTVTEGNGGSSVATFTVNLAPVNPSQAVTVNYATANGSATTGNNDYLAANGTLTFSPGTATQTFNVVINGDTITEPNESFVVNLSNASNAAIGDAQGTATINNDDGAVGPAVNIVSTTVRAGQFIQFVVSGGPANPLDWVTITPVSGANSAYLDWLYLNGSKTPPTSGRSSATLQFRAPMTPGTYNVRFFANNRLSNWLATSVTITVTP